MPIACDAGVLNSCAQSPRYDVIVIGAVERWNDGFMPSKPDIPMFQYSNAAFYSYASEIFLSGLQKQFSAVC